MDMFLTAPSFLPAGVTLSVCCLLLFLRDPAQEKDSAGSFHDSAPNAYPPWRLACPHALEASRVGSSYMVLSKDHGK